MARMQIYSSYAAGYVFTACYHMVQLAYCSDSAGFRPTTTGSDLLFVLEGLSADRDHAASWAGYARIEGSQ